MAFCYSGTSLSKDAYASFNLVIMKESLWLWRLWLGMPFYNYFLQDNFQLFHWITSRGGDFSIPRNLCLWPLPISLESYWPNFSLNYWSEKSVDNHWSYLIKGQRISGPIPTLAVSTIAWVDTFPLSQSITPYRNRMANGNNNKTRGFSSHK